MTVNQITELQNQRLLTELVWGISNYKTMKKHTFSRDKQKIVLEAQNYQEAMAALIFKVGSETEAVLWLYEGNDFARD